MAAMAAGPRARAPVPWSRIAALFVFAAAMGWLEAVVVVYIRALLGIAHGALPPDPATLEAKLLSLPWLMPTEQTREAATIVMLAGVAWIAGRSWWPRFGAFIITFGTWDIFYYVALYALLRWPPSLATMDLLFLIPPGPWWYQPVWVPVAISCAMIACGTWLMRRGRGAGSRI